jgi:predicted nucleic acid-binding protein
MILVDSSVWIAHIRATHPVFVALLNVNRVLTHPFVIGELALGLLPDRTTFLRSLQNLPMAVMASDTEVLRLIEQQRLAGAGIGYVDSHLLASTKLTLGAAFWSFDKRLSAVANYLGLTPELDG